MSRLHFLTSLVLATAILTSLPACSSFGLSASPDQAYEQLLFGSPPADGRVLVNPDPDSPLISAVGGLPHLPSPASLNAGSGPRSSSFIASEIVREGADWQPGLPSQGVAAYGSDALFSASSGPSGLSGSAFAVYQFSLSGFDLSSALQSSWRGTDDQYSGVYLGLANFTRNRWDWFSLNPLGGVKLDSLSGYQSFSSLMYCAVVVTGQQDLALERIYLGSSISGTVLDTSGQPVSGVRISVPGVSSSVASDLEGYFQVLGVYESDNLPVGFKRSGFVSTVERYEVQAGADAFQTITMAPRAAAVSIDASTGGSVSLPDGGEVSLPAGGIVDGGGAAYSGMLKVTATLLDLSDPAQSAACPADFSALGLDDQITPLGSYGVLEVNLTSPQGAPLQLAPGNTAALKVPIPATLKDIAPATTGYYSFDETVGYWIREGDWVKDAAGDYYEAEASHFSMINLDDATEPACFRVYVHDRQGHPFYSTRVTLTQTKKGGREWYGGSWSAWTTPQGYACVQTEIYSNVKIVAEIRGSAVNDPELDAGSVIKACSETYYGDGCPNTHEIVILQKPVGVITASPRSGPGPLSVDFDGSASFDRDGAIDKYYWDWNGAIGGFVWEAGNADGLAQHTFDADGQYPVALKVVDDQGLEGIDTTVVLVGTGGGSGGDYWKCGRDLRNSGQSKYAGPQTNHLQWTSEQLGHRPGSPYYQFAVWGSPLLGSDGTLFWGSPDQYVYALNPADGSVVWQSYPIADEAFDSSGAIASDGTLYYGSVNGFIHAYNPVDGGELWNLDLGGPAGYEPFPLTVGFGGKLIAAGPLKEIYWINPEGEVFRHQFQGGYSGSCPLVGPDGSVYSLNSGGGINCYDVDGDWQWHQPLNEGQPWFYGAPVMSPDGTIYLMGDYGCWALDSASGELQAGFSQDSNYHSSHNMPAVGSDGDVYLVDTTGNLRRIDGQSGAVEWSFQMLQDDGNPSLGVPLLDANGLVYAGSSSGDIYCVSPAGEEVWHYALPLWSIDNLYNRIAAQPVLAEDGTLYVAGWDCRIYAFRDLP